MAIASDYYKYKDENGILRFTDDFSEVPKDQRESIIIDKVYQVKEKPSPQPPDDGDLSEDNNPLSGDSGTLDNEVMTKSESLHQERMQLEQSLKNLESGRTDLINQLVKMKRPEEKKACREKINQLNIDIQLYEKRRNQFIEKAQIYNKSVQQHNENTVIR